MQLFHKIHDLIKEGKSVELLQSGAPSKIVPRTSSETTTSSVIDPVSTAVEDTFQSTSWNSFHLPPAQQKRGRPRNNNRYFTAYHKHNKKSKLDFDSLNPLDEEEIILREEAEHLKMVKSDEQVEQEVVIEVSFPNSPTDLVDSPIEVNYAINLIVTIY